MTFQKTLRKLLNTLVLVGLGIFVFGTSIVFGTWFYIKNQVQGQVVEVPDLYGMSRAEAIANASDRGLIVQIDPAENVHSHVIGRDHVLLQIPRPGRKVKSGRMVEITLSAGPEKKLIPPLEGETLHFSEALLKQADTRATVVSKTPYIGAGRGRIVAQHPAPGEEIGLRQGVSVLVSEGPQEPWYVMPDLVGFDYHVVKAQLDKHGFKVTTKYRSIDEDRGPVILEQSPLSGYPIRKSQSMTLVVNKEF